MAALFPPNANPQYAPYGADPSANLQFYGGNNNNAASSSMGGGRSSLEGNMTSANPTASSFASASTTSERAYLSSQMSFWSAFGTGGFSDEPGLMEELGVNLPHIMSKSATVLNPLHRYSPNHQRDAHMMDDTDLAGPLLFCFVFGILLFLVSWETSPE